MKNIIKIGSCFVLLFVICNKKVNALIPEYEIRKDIDIKIVSTVTPTPTSILIKPIKDIEIDIMPLATKTPTPIIVTQVVTATPNPTVSVSPTPQATSTETEKVTIEPTVSTTEEIKDETGRPKVESDSSTLFWAATIGLLVLIVIMQIWSSRNKEDKKDDRQ